MKKDTESNQEYRERVINAISPSFCAAKWYNATIWLNNGTTASCHHPPAHNIVDFENGESFEDLKKNPSMIHNTTYKKMVRKQMLMGERPKECEYCWKVEDIGPEQVSDRVFKTVIYEDDEIKKCQTEHKESADVDLKTLEIAFDANCNFSCSYCNASFSTAWQRDIKEKGPYQNLVSDGSKAFQHDGSWVKQFKKDDVNPYTQAFWDWWPKLSKSLTELRITGGEATISPEFWKLIEWWKKNPETNVRFAVNSNLGVVDRKLDDLIDASKYFKDFVLFSSCEATGAHAEYIRDGLNWENWKVAAERMVRDGNIQEFHVMMTINFLCLYSITEFMDWCNELKEKYGRFFGVFSVNILRFPSFMSPGTLPEEMRRERADHIENWLNKAKENPLMHEMEIDAVARLVSYLREVDTPHRGTSSIESRQRDVKSFFKQYDKRREGKNFKKTFPELAEWFDSIPDTNIAPIKDLEHGSSAKGWGLTDELAERAKEEGWVLDAQFSNPGSKDFVENRYSPENLATKSKVELVEIYKTLSVSPPENHWSIKDFIYEIIKLQSTK